MSATPPRRRRAATCALLVALSLAAGCTFRHERFGAPIDRAASFALEPGVTTLRAALETLGPPDEVVVVGDVLRLVYQYRRRDEDVLRLSYRLQLLAVIDGNGEEVLLVLDFDADDRLLHVVRPRERGR